MKVDSILILAAGSGSRMGEIGKDLPKVQWPIFEKSLLQLQIEYARRFFPTSHIYINLFHEKERLKSYIEHSSFAHEVTIIEEQEKLDIGGAIHNLAHILDYSGNLLILNGDQFLEMNQKTLERELNKLSDNAGILFSYEVNSNDEYNALISDGLFFREVVKNKEIPRDTKMMTYTGLSLWNLEKLNPIKGMSRFFDTVANTKNGSILLITIKDFVYWDFGTIKRYYHSMFNLLKTSQTDFKTFLIETGAFDTSKVTVNGYHSNSGINLSGKFKEECFYSILLSNTEQNVDKEKFSIIYGNIIQQVDQA